jgi:hypothetical protein
MKDNKFNVTNPYIIVKIDEPLKISPVLLNQTEKDFHCEITYKHVF